MMQINKEGREKRGYRGRGGGGGEREKGDTYIYIIEPL